MCRIKTVRFGQAFRLELILALLAALSGTLPAMDFVAAGDAQWPCFRGPQRTGSAPRADPPVEWSETKNVRWKTPLEGKGHSSPIVWGDRVYVLSAAKTDKPGRTGEPSAAEGSGSGSDDTGGTGNVHQFIVSAYNRGTGKREWRTVVREEVPHESLHATASQASASPVTDGEHIWASFGSRGLYCLDMQGRVVWKADFGQMHTRNGFGEGSSPAVHGDLVVVNWDHEGDSFIAALDKKTGEERWRRTRDEQTSWSTPLIVRDGERDVVVVSAANRVRGYDLKTGADVWNVGGLGPNVIPTPVTDGETLWAMSGWREAHGMAVRFRGARGDLTGTERIAWTTDRGLSYVPSAVLHDGRVYFFQRFTGILSCYELQSGRACYEPQRIENFENIYASPVAARGRIYGVSRDGSAVVLRAGEKFEVLARNELDDTFNATPALVGDTIILRGDNHLYSIAVD